MCGHKPICFIVSLLVIIGGLNWGIVGLGSLLGHGSDWNVVNMLLGAWPMVEAVVYVLVGLSALMTAVFMCKYGKECPCNKMK